MKYIDSEKLKAEIERLKQDNETSDDKEYAQYEIDVACGYAMACEEILSIIASLQQEQPMPDSTKLIELWHEDKEMLKEKDFRDDPWRLAYNAFMCGFGRGIAVNKQEKQEVDLEKAARYVYESWMGGTMDDVRRNMVELGKVLNARKEE